MTAVIEIDDLALAIDGTPILRDVSLHVAAGEICGLLGPNGAGKSTTIAAMMGLLPATAGRLRVLGHEPGPDAAAIRAHVGVMPEQNGFYDWMTAERYLGFFAGLYGIERSAHEVADRIDAVGLAPRAGQRIGTYSRGMRQRLGLARALIGGPELLVLDEPTNGLDPRGRRDIHDLLIRLAGDHRVAVLLCTHLLDDVARLCDRIVILVDGRTVAEGTTEMLMAARGGSPRFRLRLRAASEPPAYAGAEVTVIAHEADVAVVEVNPAVAPEDAWRALLGAGWPIVEIVHESGGLEELYLTLTEGGAA